MIQFQEYLQSEYPGFASFIDTIIKPIFGESFHPHRDLQEMIDFPDDIDDFDKISNNRDESFRTLAVESGLECLLELGTIQIQGDTRPIYVYDITVSNRRQLSRNRKGIQQLIARTLNNQSGAFMLFHYKDETWEWRFSYKFVGKDKEDSTDSKRFTYLLGKEQVCKTAAQRFTNLLNKKGKIAFEDITEAFSVEKISKEFFEKYKSHYEKFCQFVYDNKNNPELFGPEFSKWEDKTIRDYVKKLLGRIVFLHFLQKKGWLGVLEGGEWGTGDKQYMLHLFENSTAEQKKNFLDEILEPLFRQMDTILCGGLFERDILDEPSSIFLADDFRNLFEFFSEYNFTIDENDPSDAEVGIDPEMLGMIFENLLEDNKDKGAFYTPKEIVQYMCRESLIAYLQTDVEDADIKASIREFVTTHEISALKSSEVFRVDKKLREVKICDPAIGSGAFPMGLLKELFECRMAIEGNEESKTPADIKKDIIQNSIYGVDIEKGAVDIARLRFWLALIIDEQTPQALPNLDYKIMQGNSLIPTFQGEYVNLSPSSENTNQKHIHDMRKRKEELLLLKRMFYKASGDEKLKLTIQIKDAILNLVAQQMGYEIRVWGENNHVQGSLFSDAEQITIQEVISNLPEDKQRFIDEAKAIRARLHDTSLPLADRAQTDIQFFDWRIMFTEVFDVECNNGGFDIVIGNPPYINVELIPVADKEIYKKTYNCFYKRSDIFALFLENALLSLSNDRGKCTFIIPSVIHTNMSYQPLRDIILDRNWLSEVCYTGGKVFNAPTVDTTILILNKNGVDEILLKNAVDFNNHTSHSVKPNYFKSFQNVISVGESKADSIFVKILNSSYLLLGEHYNMFQGIVTGLNPAFLFENTLDAISKGIDEQLLHSFVQGKDIAKYTIKCREKRILYLNNDTVIENFPRTKQWMIPFKDKLSERREAKKGTIRWYSLQWPRVKNELDTTRKILLQRTRNEALKTRIVATIDDQGVYGAEGIYFLVPITEEIPLSYLLGILNSALMNYLFATKYLNLAIKTDYVKSLRIPLKANKIQQKIVYLVDNILSAKKLDPGADTSSLEAEIDRLVYDLYGLTEEEIKIVEGRNE